MSRPRTTPDRDKVDALIRRYGSQPPTSPTTRSDRLRNLLAPSPSASAAKPTAASSTAAADRRLAAQLASFRIEDQEPLASGTGAVGAPSPPMLPGDGSITLESLLETEDESFLGPSFANIQGTNSSQQQQGMNARNGGRHPVTPLFRRPDDNNTTPRTNQSTMGESHGNNTTPLMSHSYVPSGMDGVEPTPTSRPPAASSPLTRPQTAATLRNNNKGGTTRGGGLGNNNNASSSLRGPSSSSSRPRSAAPMMTPSPGAASSRASFPTPSSTSSSHLRSVARNSTAGLFSAHRPATTRVEELYENGRYKQELRKVLEEDARRRIPAKDLKQCTFNPQINRGPRSVTPGGGGGGGGDGYSGGSVFGFGTMHSQDSPSFKEAAVAERQAAWLETVEAKRKQQRDSQRNADVEEMYAVQLAKAEERAKRQAALERAKSAPRIRMPGDGSVEPIVQRFEMRRAAEEAAVAAAQGVIVMGLTNNHRPTALFFRPVTASANPATSPDGGMEDDSSPIQGLLHQASGGGGGGRQHATSPTRPASGLREGATNAAPATATGLRATQPAAARSTSMSPLGTHGQGGGALMDPGRWLDAEERSVQRYVERNARVRALREANVQRAVEEYSGSGWRNRLTKPKAPLFVERVLGEGGTGGGAGAGAAGTAAAGGPNNRSPLRSSRPGNDSVSMSKSLSSPGRPVSVNAIPMSPTSTSPVKALHRPVTKEHVVKTIVARTDELAMEH